MIDEALERNYVISKLRTDLPEVVADWSSRSEVFRSNTNATLDIAYGQDPREKIDVFYSGAKAAPMLVYFHGGYWQRCDKSMFSFIAEPFVERGVDVAIIGYPLCPQVSLTELVASIRRSMVYLFRQALDLQINRDRINLCGSSAGGHLVAMMLATDWQSIGEDLPQDLFKLGVPISALYDLEPLRFTTLNDALGLDEKEARLNSPLFLSSKANAPILAAVGGSETPVFFNQQEDFVKRWQSDAYSIDQHVESSADHYDLIERLGNADSGIVKAILQRLK